MYAVQDCEVTQARAIQGNPVERHASAASLFNLARHFFGAFERTEPPRYGFGPARELRTINMGVRRDANAFADLVAKVEAGELRIDIRVAYPLSDADLVHQKSVAGNCAARFC